MRIAVLNPNSSEAVTRSMARCLERQVALTDHQIDCHTLTSAPKGIETDEDVRAVAPKAADWVRSVEADACVIACFSDPGLTEAREVAGKPVFGIAESAYGRTLVLGQRFGVISLGQSSISRHRAMIERMGILSRLGGDRAVEMSVAEANDADRAASRIAAVGRQLREEDGADVLVLGCAGMGEQRERLQEETGCIVIDPVQAAVADAVAALDIGWVRPQPHV
ncbi:aspartate/glutamate racemase family protein [Pelagovum pacificum]|uniref:Hydantoin racemase n=1 Tax=Pelagovum pacificum TaxID=2588711 RepID=A0A5C5G7C6_9RHOB|nr:aspartate/glutamate racemase family protein [Pelagovum pacificum]QQA41983.1 aspartate/glutamate racemase family protein [Pelagovum pacificum]TNY30576.1 hydantoin racemase [Pelagovum pacificum]